MCVLEPIKQLKTRYHMTALITLIAKNYFEEDAVEHVNEIVTSLEKLKTSNKSKESEEQQLWGKTMYT